MKRILALAFLFAFETAPSNVSPFADLNGDGIVNVADVQVEINTALGISQGIIEQTDAFMAGAPFVLSHLPVASPAPQVYVNGILQLAKVDYTITGQTVTMAASDLGASPVIQVIYWFIGS
jgi:hypothetical protein